MSNSLVKTSSGFLKVDENNILKIPEGATFLTEDIFRKDFFYWDDRFNNWAATYITRGNASLNDLNITWEDKVEPYFKMYISVLDKAPKNMVPTLVAHSVLGAHLKLSNEDTYKQWLSESYKKVVVSVDQKSFDKIFNLDQTIYAGHEYTILSGEKSCLITIVKSDEIPNVLKFAKLWE